MGKLVSVQNLTTAKAAEKSLFYFYFLAFVKLKFWNEVLLSVHT
jgi:hypothetical protein